MNPFQNRLLRGIGYLFAVTGVLNFGFGAFGLGYLIFGPVDQRTDAIGSIALGFGGAFANGLVGAGLLLGTRTEHQ